MEQTSATPEQRPAEPTQPPAEPTQPLAERGSNRSQRPASQAFKDFIASGWGPERSVPQTQDRGARYAARRRAAIGRQFPGERLVIPAGGLKTRSNDTDYRFRPHTAFAHLTALGMDREPDAVLVLHPRLDDSGSTHRAVLYFKPRAPRDSEEFYADSRYGELWVGARPTLREVEQELGLVCRDIADLAADLAAPFLGDDDTPTDHVPPLRVVPGADPSVEALIHDVRSGTGGSADEGAAAGKGAAAGESAAAGEDVGQSPDESLAEALSELRLIKDAYEIEQMRLAVQVTVDGFADVVRSLREAVGHRRGERVVETAFESRARRAGNGVGYDTIAAAGAHACTLHWIRNDGVVREGDLLLLDAGVEVDSLYTADVTRTLPVSGRFTEPQRRVYQAVLDAADAGFAVAKPGAKFRDVHNAAMEVLAHRLADWGLLPVSAAESLDLQHGGQHRRWMVHGTSHHLGMDVHDCAQARREMYLDGELEPGMIFTIEPGLYFRPDDHLAPPELRGLAVRIEDDVLVTEDGYENLSSALPRTPDDVEAWMAGLGR